MKRILILCLLAISVSMIPGCARVPATATVPGRAATPFENALAWNAAIANANLAAAQGVVGANRAGVLTDDQTGAILQQVYNVSQANRQLTLILQAGPAAIKGSSANIKNFVAQIQSGGSQIVQLGAIGIKNPDTQAMVKTQIDSLTTFAQNIVDVLSTAGLI